MQSKLFSEIVLIDADTAKAAQWCVEQGILTAPGETTFRPNGWVTRVKVIQTWNTAFPKQ